MRYLKHSAAPALRDLLYLAQANDAYWHGLFGGLYLPHLRRAVYNALVELEAGLDRASPRPPSEQRDADMDGVEEMFLHNGILQAVVRCDGDAAVIELDSYSLRHNFGDTLCRREEHYYRKMHLGEQHHFHSEGIASAHDRVSFKHPIEPADIEPDTRPRSLFVDRVSAGTGTRRRTCLPVVGSQQPGPGPIRGAVEGGQRRQGYLLNDNRLSVRYRFNGVLPCRFETQINLAMPSADGFLGRYVFEGGIPGGFGAPLKLDAMTTLSWRTACWAARWNCCPASPCCSKRDRTIPCPSPRRASKR